jgi:hypothetical protein
MDGMWDTRADLPQDRGVIPSGSRLPEMAPTVDGPVQSLTLELVAIRH